ncbi:MAG: tRNA uridine-5-carboxymethylaminomethyl(34) synthesis GTPase MnmE [Vampirovibrionales bacterium]
MPDSPNDSLPQLTPTQPLTHRLNEPTIVGLATALGPAGVAVLRVSGVQAWAIVDACFSRSLTQAEPLKALFGYIQTVEGEALDQVLVLPFKAPASFTGEDVVEIHCHGGSYLPQALLNRVQEAGAVLAQRGEFSKRAVLNGKLDLTQAESILDMVHAEGEALASVALNNLKTQGLRQQLLALREPLMEVQANLIAAMDYPEEVEEPNRPQTVAQLQALRQTALAWAGSAQQHKVYSEGLKLAILGQPNAGKSSLFNALLANNRSIVTDIAGTTRDVVSERFTLHGLPMTLVDTAGIRQHTSDTVEQLGIKRSLQAGQEADVILYVVDATVAWEHNGLPPADATILNQLPPHTPKVLLLNKQDALNPSHLNELLHQLPQDVATPWLPLSLVMQHGMDALQQALKTTLQQATGTLQESRLCLNQRQAQCMHAMAEHIALATDTFQTEAFPLDLATVPLSDALYELDKLLGMDTTEATLDVVFSRFCVGK